MRTLSTIGLALALAAGCVGDDGQTIGPRGGTLVSDDGLLSVELRPGALTEDVSLLLLATECQGEEALECYEFVPWGVMLAAPASVVFDYESCESTAAMTPDRLSLTVEAAEGMRPMPDADYDPDEGVVWASIVQLTAVELVPQ